MPTQRLFIRLCLVASLMLLMVLGRAPTSLAKGVLNAQGLAIDDRSGILFMTDSAYSVTTYDERTGAARRTFALGKTPLYPISVAVLPQAHRLYVGSRLGDVLSPGLLSVVDTVTGRVLRAFSTAPNPEAIVFGQHLERAYVLCSGLGDAPGGTVLLIDTQRTVLLKTVHIRDFPQAAVLDDESGHLFIGGMHGLYILDAGSGRVLHTLRLPTNGPSAIAVDARIHRVFVASGNRVQVLDSHTGTAFGTIALGDGVEVTALALDLATGRLLATSVNQTTLTGRLNILDVTNGTLLRQIDAGSFTTGVAVLPALDRAVTINPSFTNGPNGQFGHGEMRIVQISTGRVLDTQEVSAESLAVSSHTDRAYLTAANHLLTIVDVRTGKVLF